MRRNLQVYERWSGDDCRDSGRDGSSYPVKRGACAAWECSTVYPKSRAEAENVWAREEGDCPPPKRSQGGLSPFRCDGWGTVPLFRGHKGDCPPFPDAPRRQAGGGQEQGGGGAVR